MSTLNAAFIGLGTMGYPMAGHLAEAGISMTVYNRTAQRAQQWARDYPGSLAPTPAEAAHGADLVFVCVGNDNNSPMDRVSGSTIPAAIWRAFMAPAVTVGVARAERRAVDTGVGGSPATGPTRRVPERQPVRLDESFINEQIN